MKKMLMVLVLAAGAAFAGDDFEKNRDATDPAAPFENYGPAMTSTAEKPLVANWQEQNRAAIDAATDRATLAAFVADNASALALLAKLRGPYKTDPLTATQIAAVTQYVMGEDPCCLFFWEDFPSDGRKVWVKALLVTAETSPDAYVRQQCLEQLRWCGCKCPDILARIRALAKGDPDRGVKDLAALAVKAIEMGEKDK